MTTTEGNLAERFLQHSKNYDGSVARLPQSFSDNTKKRMVDENTIKGIAITQNIPLDNLVTGILCKYPDQLAAFVQAHGEIPFINPLKLAVQAVLTRAQDVAKVAKQIDTTDDDALREIENAEDASQDINAPDEFANLSTEAQAAMKVAMDYISDCHNELGGDGSMNSALSDLFSAAAKTPVNGMASNADGDYSADDFADFSADWYGTTTPTLPGLANIPIDTGDINTINQLPTITAGPAPTTNTAGIVNSGSTSSGGILGTLNSIFDTIKNGAGAITNATNAVTQGIGQVNGAITNIGGNVGAASINKFIADNKKMLILIGILIIATIFLAIYLSRKK